MVRFWAEINLGLEEGQRKLKSGRVSLPCGCGQSKESCRRPGLSGGGEEGLLAVNGTQQACNVEHVVGAVGTRF